MKITTLQKIMDPFRTEVVLRPEHGGKGSWVGAPAACYSRDEGCFYLLVRFRSEGVRGYMTALYKTENGLKLEKVMTLHASSIGARSIERGTLKKAANTWKLYLSYEDLRDGLWKIALAEKRDITEIRANDFEVILEGRDIEAAWVKDPVLFENMLFVHTKEPSGKAAYLLRKREGKLARSDHKRTKVRWEKIKVLSDKHEWDSYCSRITSIIKSPNGFFAFYDGASSIKENQEEKTGLAYGKSIECLESITPDGPLLTGPTGSGSIRYVEIKEIENKFYIWYEMSTEDLSHELRFITVPKQEFVKALRESL
ncbi:hypothetical protein ES707_22522 [subsurface metagenome]